MSAFHYHNTKVLTVPGDLERVYVLSCVWLSLIPWMLAHQAPLSMEFSRLDWTCISCECPLGSSLEPGDIIILWE